MAATAAERMAQLYAGTHQAAQVAVTDLDGVLRGKQVSIEKIKSMAEQGFGFCDVLFGWDAADAAYDNASFTGWHTGYPDAWARIDAATLRQQPWQKGLPLLLADFEHDARAAVVCPRSLLKRVLGQLAQHGLMAKMAQEFEWFNFMPEPGAPQHTLSAGMFGYSLLRAGQNAPYFQQLFTQLAQFGVPLEGLHTETGPGVYEAAITYSTALEAADRAVLFKAAVKAIAHQHGIVPSFMAKWNQQLPGCSGHVHQSLWTADGQANLFYDGLADGLMSQTMAHYMAGQLYCLPHILPLFAPTINSYKRLVEGAWAPTTLTWGVDNRTTALRALPGTPAATRLETRVPGADSNPYLAMAACLASGLYGVVRKLPLQTATLGNGYADGKHGRLPATLEQATLQMQHSGVAAQLFGAPFVQHFASTRLWECRQSQKAVTDWELNRYFEII
jgi:glutamine synthetase